jgi:thioesterase domain-containing protein
VPARPDLRAPLPRAAATTPVLHTLRCGNGVAPRSILIVHPGALPVSVYGGLADRLPLELGVHLLNLQGVAEYQQAALTGGRSQLSIAGIAKSFARQVPQVLRPAERYVLIGWSFGGVIAHAMAGHLTGPAAPTHLVLLDSIAAVPGYQAQVSDLSDQTLLEWFCMYLGAKRGKPATLQKVPRDLGDVLSAMTASGALLPSTTVAGLAKVFEVYVDGLRRNSLLTRDFTATAGRIPTTAVRARHSLLAEPGPLGWDRICPPGLRVLTGEGDHYSMLTDPQTTALLAGLAQSILTPTLQQAQTVPHQLTPR